MTSRSSEGFQTTDLNLAAYLIHKGKKGEKFKKGETQRGQPLGGWIFPKVDDDKGATVQELVIEYNEDKAQVNPKTFHQTLAKVRGDMYDYLGIKKKKG